MTYRQLDPITHGKATLLPPCTVRRWRRVPSASVGVAAHSERTGRHLVRRQRRREDDAGGDSHPAARGDQSLHDAGAAPLSDARAGTANGAADRGTWRPISAGALLGHHWRPKPAVLDQPVGRPRHPGACYQWYARSRAGPGANAGRFAAATRAAGGDRRGGRDGLQRAAHSVAQDLPPVAVRLPKGARFGHVRPSRSGRTHGDAASRPGQYFVPVQGDAWKLDATCDIYDRVVAPAQSMIFVNACDKAEWLHRKLAVRGFTAGMLHGEMGQRDRENAARDFRRGHSRLLVATDVVGRGFDVASVSLVINYDLPVRGEGGVATARHRKAAGCRRKTVAERALSDEAAGGVKIGYAVLCKGGAACQKRNLQGIKICRESENV
eukprot:ctg_68.g67